MGKLESKFQKEVIDTLKSMFPGCLITKTDPNYIQGFPDLLILFNDKWASLECKRSAKTAKTAKQPNQAHYVDLMNEMSFSRFIFPENKEAVLSDLQQAFQS